MVPSKHCPAAVLRRNPPEKASRLRGQALDFSKTSHSNMRMSNSRRLRNVKNGEKRNRLRNKYI